MADLRHITSFTSLGASQRLSQHLRSSPARSPSSIPSSPTSVHSSSSAIFERDIEPLAPTVPASHAQGSHHHHHHHSHHTLDPHRIPRSRNTEQIEHSVPSVLDSAAAVLTSSQSPADVAVVAPVPRMSGFASPIGSFGSRSPSPTTAVQSSTTTTRNSILLSSTQTHNQIPASARSVSASRSPPLVRATLPTIHTAGVAQIDTDGSSSSPSVVTPTSAYFTVADDSNPAVASAFSETGDTQVVPSSPADQPPSAQTQTAIPASAFSASASPSPQPHQPHPPFPQRLPTRSASASSATPTVAAATTASKRLSFISYADLLISTPTSTLPLASLTTAASAIDPPPHITGVAGPGGPFNLNLNLNTLNLNFVPKASTPTPPLGTAGLRGFGFDHPSYQGQGVLMSGSIPGGGGQLSQRPQQQRKESYGGLGHGGSGSVSAVLEDLGTGGEWEREGFGTGLEERLDVLYPRRSSAGSAAAGPALVGAV